MAKKHKQNVFVVDDDSSVRSAVAEALDQNGFVVSCFERASDCLKQMSGQNCDLLITDLKMPEMDGIELVRRSRHLIPWLPVMVITGYGEVGAAVAAMKAGAADFLEKPMERQSLLASVRSLLELNYLKDSIAGRPLSETEEKVLHLLMKGMSNKEIAKSLNRSVRTIEVHRSHIMRKFNVDNVVSLVERVMAEEQPDRAEDGSRKPRQER